MVKVGRSSGRDWPKTADQGIFLKLQMDHLERRHFCGRPHPTISNCVVEKYLITTYIGVDEEPKQVEQLMASGL